MRGISAFGVALRALRHPDVARAICGYVGTVINDFFWLQFAVKWGVRDIPVVDVDHPLDDQLPFSPDKVGAYLDFVAFWIRPLGYLGRRFGVRAQRRHAVAFLRLLQRCYREAAEVYRFRMSTTRRPRYCRGRFALIQWFDPHCLCVPSLHVMIVVAAYTFFRQAFAELQAGHAESDALNRELFDGAVAITESVLYIKQHSVNCVPAALYAISRIAPDAVSQSDVEAFVDRLFRDAPRLGEGVPEQIRAFVRDGFGRLTADGRGDADWQPAVQRFLLAYQPVDG